MTLWERRNYTGPDLWYAIIVYPLRLTFSRYRYSRWGRRGDCWRGFDCGRWAVYFWGCR